MLHQGYSDTDVQMRTTQNRSLDGHRRSTPTALGGGFLFSFVFLVSDGDNENNFLVQDQLSPCNHQTNL